MILCIGVVAVITNMAFNFDLATAILLGAVLAPTDPVLASDVQVGPPLEKVRDNVKFSLTAEAGMNDGMAFPFTWLAIALALAGASDSSFIGEWLIRDVLYRIIAGVACGFVLGRILAHFVFYLPEKKNFIVVKDGFVAIATTLLVYGITELLKGYGFIAVFVTAITLRNYERNHKYHKKLHEFTDQIERILLAIVLLLFGGSLANGILNHLTLNTALFGLAFVLVIRPVLGMLSLIGTKLHVKEKLAISFFGIRGMGSFYYLAFALHEAKFSNGEELWSIVSFIVLLSVLIHGLTATAVIKKLEHQFATEEPIEEIKNFKS
jgi:NhaP-type Na+/H+ or K+/H+ antiporter